MIFGKHTSVASCRRAARSDRSGMLPQFIDEDPRVLAVVYGDRDQLHAALLKSLLERRHQPLGGLDPGPSRKPKTADRDRDRLILAPEVAEPGRPWVEDKQRQFAEAIGTCTEYRRRSRPILCFETVASISKTVPPASRPEASNFRDPHGLGQQSRSSIPCLSNSSRPVPLNSATGPFFRSDNTTRVF